MPTNPYEKADIDDLNRQYNRMKEFRQGNEMEMIGIIATCVGAFLFPVGIIGGIIWLVAKLIDRL